MSIIRFSLVGILLGLGMSLMAQTELDAYRFSQQTLTGTARSLGMAGAFSAVGADLTSASLNPAGLGLYRRTDLVFSPGLRFIQNEGDFIGSMSQDTRTNFGFANLGVAISGKVYEGYGRNRRQATSGFMSYNIAIGFNQLENYHREINASAFNPLSSITEQFAEQANGSVPEQFGFGSYPALAWDAFLINPLANSIDQYFGAVDSGMVQQQIRMEERGRKNEWFIAAGGNIDDFLYIGLKIGIQDIRYEQSYAYTEEDVNGVHNFFDDDPNSNLEYPFNSLLLAEDLITTGTGINGALGVIIRPTDAFRIGLSFTSPTVLGLVDEYNARMEHDFTIVDQVSGLEKDTLAVQRLNEPFQFDYNLTSPYRVTIGLMYLFKKYGFISADVDFVDYSSSRLNSAYETTDPAFYDFRLENDLIRDLFSPTINARVGAEGRVGIYRFRAGYAYQGGGLEREAVIY
ncbi:MAG: hypothetical protein AAGI38_14135, partial [Bacteroidota bacterium]